MVYTNGYKDEVYAIRTFITPIVFPPGSKHNPPLLKNSNYEKTP